MRGAPVAALASLLLCGCLEDWGEPPKVDWSPPSAPASAVSETREACREHYPRRAAWFGDLHVHTALSMDAWVRDTRTTPDAAYRFARGEAVATGPLGPDGEPTVWCMRGQAMENRAHRVLAVPKTATIHELAVHPLQPHLICMLTSAGLSVYRVGAHWPPSVAVSKTEVEPSRPIRAERRKSTLQSVPPPALPTFSGRDRPDSGAEDFESLSRKGSGRAGSVLSGGSAGYNGSADFDSASASAMTETLPITWTVEQVGTWLERIGLGRHKETFLENDVDGRLLLKLSEQGVRRA